MNLDGHFHLCLPKAPNPIIGGFAVELAGLLGFHSLALDFPILSSRVSKTPGDFNVIITVGLRKVERDATSLTICLDSQDAANETLAAIASDFAAFFPTNERAKSGLAPTNFRFASDNPLVEPARDHAFLGIENFLLKGPWLQDTDGDFLPDQLNAGITLPPAASLDVYATAANLAAVLAAQTTVYTYPICDSTRPGQIHIVPSTAPASIKVTGNAVYLAGSHLSAFSELLLNMLLPDQQGITPSNVIGADGHSRLALPLTNWLAHLRDDLAMRQTDGQFAWVKALKAIKNTDLISYFNPDAPAWNRRNKQLATAQVKSYKDDALVWELKRDLPWEVTRFKANFSKEVLPQVKPGDKLVISAALSEDRRVREQLLKELVVLFEAKGAKADIQLISAYKQGYSWLDEYISPKLKSLKSLDHVVILFKAYLPSGKTEFLEEDGATPKITSERADDPNHWFDMPIRPLQELYPIDDTLASNLSVERSKISFEYYQGDKDLTYEVLAYDVEGNTLLNESLSVVWAERPYLDRYPDIGKVHPPTGYLKVTRDDQLLVDRRIQTDLEVVWDIFQAEILPAVTDYVVKKTNGAITTVNQPFFSKLEINLDISEPDDDLSSRTDRISSLDAMHEDLYFVALDYFRTLGLRETGEKITSPGLILPRIRKATGHPKLRVRLTERCAPAPQITQNGKALASALNPTEIQASITAITQSPSGLNLHLSIEGPKQLAPVLEAYGDLLENNHLKNSLDGSGVATINCAFNGNALQSWHLPHPKRRAHKAKPLKPENFHIPQTEVIGYTQYLKLINQVQRLPGLRVYPLAESYQGRVIHAIEVVPETRGWRPRAKWVTAQPSIYINARHHANEVSGTNTNFNLAKSLATEPKLRELSRSLNIVLLPFENADGAALHYELMRDNPRWKLHVARYNALGTEIAQEYFKDDTIQTEALAFTRVWRAWLPDVIVDDHGVPTHEWDQPFSGYTSPWFKGFWLPRALLYGYFFHIKDERFDENLAVNKAVEHAVAQSLKTDDRVIALNQDWRDRFYTYANKWLPSLFPANYYEDMISYWVPAPYAPVHNYASVRFPWVTAVSFVSEVSDETAQGEYLSICALAHYNQDLAILNLMAGSTVFFDQSIVLDSQGGKLTWQRKRPVACNPERMHKENTAGGTGD